MIIIKLINNIKISLKHNINKSILKKNKKNKNILIILIKLNLIKNISFLEKNKISFFLKFFNKNPNLKNIKLEEKKFKKELKSIYIIKINNKYITSIDLKKNKNKGGIIVAKIQV